MLSPMGYSYCINRKRPMATIQCKDGITYEVIKAEPYTHNGKARIEYTCKRPRGKRIYWVVQYENGLFSTAA